MSVLFCFICILIIKADVVSWIREWEKYYEMDVRKLLFLLFLNGNYWYLFKQIIYFGPEEFSELQNWWLVFCLFSYFDVESECCTFKNTKKTEQLSAVQFFLNSFLKFLIFTLRILLDQKEMMIINKIMANSFSKRGF